MKLKISRDELLRATTRTQSVVERRGTLPILANVLIRAEDDHVTLCGTDLEVGVVSTHPAEIELSGRTTLAARKLHEIVRELDQDEVTIEALADSRVRICAGASDFSLLAVSADEYPSLPSSEGAAFVPIEAGLLGSLIDRTLYATSTDETRYHLNGIHMEVIAEGRLRLVATDGHRLALADATPSSPITLLTASIIVPRKGVAEIRRLCDDTDGTIELALQDNFLLVRRPGLILSARLIDAQFPNYQGVLPAHPQIRIAVDHELLLHAVRRIALVATDRSGGFTLRLDGQRLRLSAVNPDLGEVHEEIPVEYDGDPFTTSFDARYVIEALGSIASKEALLELTDELSPAQIRPADSRDQIAVVMPMRL
jgi:DNA polymerase III subunit beta